MDILLGPFILLPCTSTTKDTGNVPGRRSCDPTYNHKQDSFVPTRNATPMTNTPRISKERQSTQVTTLPSCSARTFRIGSAHAVCLHFQWHTDFWQLRRHSPPQPPRPVTSPPCRRGNEQASTGPSKPPEAEQETPVAVQYVNTCQTATETKFQVATTSDANSGPFIASQ